MIKKVASFFCYAAFVVLIILDMYYEIFNTTFQISMFQKFMIIIASIILLFLGSYLRVLTSKKGKAKKERIIYNTVFAVFIIYLIQLFILLFVEKNFGRRFDIKIWLSNISNFSKYFEHYFNIKPFKTILGYTSEYRNGFINLNYLITFIVGNLFAFMPFGIFIPLLFKNIRGYFKFTILMFLIILSCEALQFITFTGCFDVDDIIVNLFGALYIFVIIKLDPFKKLISKLD